MTERRRFIATASGVVAAAAAAPFVDAPNVIAQPKVQWRHVTTAYLLARRRSRARPSGWPKLVDEATGGRFRIEAFARTGRSCTAFECFAATSQGHHRGIHGRTGRTGRPKEPAIEWFRDDAVRHESRRHDGLVLRRATASRSWEETYRAPSTSCRVRAQPSRPRWPDGSGRRSTTIGDYKGLKMRIGASNLGTQGHRQGGWCAGPHPASGIFAALERGVIDAAEWVGPLRRHAAGPPPVRRATTTTQAGTEPGAMSEFTFNRKAYEALPVDVRRILDQAAGSVQVSGFAAYQAKNGIALESSEASSRARSR